MKRLALLWLLASAMQAYTSGAMLATLNRIYVGPMGPSDDSERFRTLLEAELTKVGFMRADSAEEADGVLTGALAVEVHANGSVARAMVVLKARDGELLWDGDFESHAHLGREDTVKLRAQDVAKALRKAVDSAAKHR